MAVVPTSEKVHAPWERSVHGCGMSVHSGCAWVVTGIICVVYLDDILIFSHTQEDHDLHVLQILHALDQSGLLASVDKCECDKDSLKYLGLILGKNGMSMHPKKAFHYL